MATKKSRGFLGMIGAAGLAALTIIPSTVPQNAQAANQKTNVSQKQDNKQQIPVQAPTSLQVTDQLPTHIGGLELGGKSSGFGISPKDYGEKYVRRGTHRKSNKI
jgi:hypothetical protein